MSEFSLILNGGQIYFLSYKAVRKKHFEMTAAADSRNAKPLFAWLVIGNGFKPKPKASNTFPPERITETVVNDRITLRRR